MSQSSRRVKALQDELEAARAEVRRLQADVVRLHAHVQVLEEAQRTATVAPVRRGLASLIDGPRAG